MKTSNLLLLGVAGVAAYALLAKKAGASDSADSGANSSYLSPATPAVLTTVDTRGEQTSIPLTSNQQAVNAITQALRNGQQIIPASNPVQAVYAYTSGGKNVTVQPGKTTITGPKGSTTVNTSYYTPPKPINAPTHAPTVNAAAIAKYLGR